jgi:hypothetical protein
MTRRDGVPAEFADIILGNPSDDQGEPDAPEPFADFLSNAQLRGAGANPEGLAQETSQLDARVRNIYSDISERATTKAAAPAAEPDPQALMKRYMGQPRCCDKRTVRLEKSENGKWIMEYDANGELISGHAWGFWPEEKGEASL